MATKVAETTDLSGERNSVEEGARDKKVRRNPFSSMFTCAFALFLVFGLMRGLSEASDVTGFVANWLFENNFHEVDPGRFYRSGQMREADLRAAIRTYGIKTVIDLRWKAPSQPGKPTEEEVVDSVGARYLHFPLLGSREASYEQVRDLINVYHEVETPVLVHCVSGTHRSGVASAIWLLSRENMGEVEARNQLSPRYGYFYLERRFKSFLQNRPTIDHIIWHFLDDRGKTGETLLQWTEREINAEKDALLFANAERDFA